jgi:DNA-binding response OmpR family regulator
VSPNRLRVLIADDNPAIAKALSRLLAADYDVGGCVGSGSALLAILQTNVPDVVVLDLHLPDVDGVNLCGALTLTHPQVRIVVFTAADHPETRARAFDAGASAFVDKLALPDELLLAVKCLDHTRG